VSRLGPLPAVPEVDAADPASFAGLRAERRPAVLRGLVAGWPAVASAKRGDAAIVDYLIGCAPTRPVSGLMGPAEAHGRFFYNDEVTGFNFRRLNGRLEDFLRELLRIGDAEAPPAMAVQSEAIAELLPAFAAANRLGLLPGAAPRIWIGNRIRVAPHYDLMENVACCVAGRRRFTLFPPDQLANLYPGPFELTPAGTPVSMVDPFAPDLDRYPRFAEAWSHASEATLEPGDALYLPYMWWHGVESLEPVSILVNYWWTDHDPALGVPYDALLHNLLAFRHLPPADRAIWRAMLDHYVFEANGDPAAHLPRRAQGILGPASPQRLAAMRAMLRRIFGGGGK